MNEGRFGYFPWGPQRLGMIALRVAVTACLGLACREAPARAQPKGPAEVISGARSARARRELAEAVNKGASDGDSEAAGAPKPDGGSPLPPGHPAVEEETRSPANAPAVPPSHLQGRGARSPHGTARDRKPLSEAEPNPQLPAGTIRVRVVDPGDTPLPEVEVRIGILKSDGGRESVSGTTDAAGVRVFSDLSVGDDQAYRAEVRAGGARFGSNPFRLPRDRGYDVLLRRLNTTDDMSEVVLYVGAVSIELVDERFKLAQHLRLINVGAKAYVFPDGGLTIPLPEGFTAFQTQETMGDQRLTSNEQGVNIQGSIPPGQTVLLWGYDVPVDGTEMIVDLQNPFTTYAMRVLADAAPGLALRVDGLPPPKREQHNGSSFWVTEAVRRPEQGPLRQLRIHLSGIPGPGPSRWIASSLALLLVAVGFVVSRRTGDARSTHAALQARKQALLEELATLSREHEQGDVGKEYFADEKARLTDALAVVLWEEEQQG